MTFETQRYFVEEVKRIFYKLYLNSVHSAAVVAYFAEW